MIFTTEMIQLFAVVLGRDCESVTEALLREGVMQFINISELDAENPDSLSAVKSEISLTEITDLRKRVEGFLYAGGIVPSPPDETDLNNRAAVDARKENAHLDKMASERDGVRERQRTIQQEILKLEDIKRQVELYGIGISDVTLPAKHSFISMQIGKLPALNAKQLEDALKDFPSLNIAMGQEGDMAHHLLISMKRDNEQIGKILGKVGWTRVELPGELRSVKKDVHKELSTKLEKLAAEQKKVELKVNELVKREEQYLTEIWTNLRVNELFHYIQANFKSSSCCSVGLAFVGYVSWSGSHATRSLFCKRKPPMVHRTSNSELSILARSIGPVSIRRTRCPHALSVRINSIAAGSNLGAMITSAKNPLAPLALPNLL